MPAAGMFSVITALQVLRCCNLRFWFCPAMQRFCCQRCWTVTGSVAPRAGSYIPATWRTLTLAFALATPDLASWVSCVCQPSGLTPLGDDSRPATATARCMCVLFCLRVVLQTAVTPSCHRNIPCVPKRAGRPSCIPATGRSSALADVLCSRACEHSSCPRSTSVLIQVCCIL